MGNVIERMILYHKAAMTEKPRGQVDENGKQVNVDPKSAIPPFLRREPSKSKIGE